LVVSSDLVFSKFQNFKISNNALFDPGIVPEDCDISSDSKTSTMEADCQDDNAAPAPVPKTETSPDLNQFLSVITSHITDATTKMTSAFNKVLSANSIFKQEIMDANTDFKQDIRTELAELRDLLNQQQRILHSLPITSNLTVPQVAQAVPSSSVSSSQPVNISVVTPFNSGMALSADSSSTDQVLLLLTDLFSKMANALTEKQSDSKAGWPKFSGDVTRFWSWHLAILTQLSITPWHELYDHSRNNIVESSKNTSLNKKLYSKLILSLEGTALQHVVSRKHLMANGLAVLQDLVHTYKPKNIPEVIAAKTSEFCGTMKGSPLETVDAYYNRFQELLDDIAEADEPISNKSALSQFLFMLGPEFEPIQHN